MGAGIRFGAGLVIALLWVLPWGVRGAEAEPSASCRSLAGRFASTPEEMDLQALAALASCLATEIGLRVGATGTSEGSSEQIPAPSSPQMAPPPPPPQDATPQPEARRYGDWPAPPAWMENWPSPNPW